MLAFPAGAMAVPPSNDSSTSALGLTVNQTEEGENNTEATEQAGEPLTCNGASPFGKTLWYGFTLTVRGSVSITAGGNSTNPNVEDSRLDTVAVLHPAGDAPAIACNDDATPNGRSSEVNVADLAPGTYFVQVGGFKVPPQGAFSGGFDYGLFNVRVNFTEDLDLDNDGFNRAPGPDCNDSNPGINPNATDVNYNGVDEDCRGGDDLDADNDGFNRGPDCNDANATMSPGRKEVKGNFVDENCDGKRPAARLSPTPDVSIFRQPIPAKRGTVVKGLTVFRLRSGYRITVKCKGKGCPKKTQRRTIKKGRKTSFNAYRRRFLRKGAVITVFVTRPKRNRLGEFFRYKMGATKFLPPTEGCLAPGKLKKRSCRT